jgi:AmmeMemoRadiSam system protein B
MMDPLPRLRPLEILRLPQSDGSETFLLRDPEGYAEDELVMSEAALFVAAHGDGEHTLEQLGQNFALRYGRPMDPDQARAVFDRLETAFMIESPAFLEERERARQAFLEAAVRLPAHAGRSYPADPETAREAVKGFFRDAASIEEPGERPAGRLTGVVAPHIDLRVGGAATALAYRLLDEATSVTTVIVLGTSHGCGRPAWIVTDKPYETPLGMVPVDVDAYRALARAAETDPEDVYYHRKEHSIEFQALFLAALREQGRKLSLVPVLCGSQRDTSTPLLDDPFLVELRRFLDARGDTAIAIAAADLAHVGPRFGDTEALTPPQLQLLEKKDRATLEFVRHGDAPGFMQSVLEAGDPRRICGLAPIAGLLAGLGKTNGKVLRYEQAIDDTGTVSYASVGLWTA